MTNLVSRVFVGLVGLPVVLGVLWLGGWWLFGLVVAAALIAVHEFGHYATARLLGMRVLEFAFGFPPRAVGWMRNGIMYSINWIPFGGFVRILGQDDFRVQQEGAGEPGSFTSKARKFGGKPRLRHPAALVG